MEPVEPGPQEETSPVEVQSSFDDGWYEADLSVIRGRGGQPKLKADFCHYVDDVETIETYEGVLRRVRFQSHQVQENECQKVKEGLTVCALRKTPKSQIYFDARVTRAKYDHENVDETGSCGCRFQVRWLEGQGKSRQSTLPSADICLIETKDILTHPRVAEFQASFAEWAGRAKGSGSAANNKRKQANPQKLDSGNNTAVQPPVSLKAKLPAAAPETVVLAGIGTEDASGGLQPVAMRKKKHTAEPAGAGEGEGAGANDTKVTPVQRRAPTVARKTGAPSVDASGLGSVQNVNTGSQRAAKGGAWESQETDGQPQGTFNQDTAAWEEAVAATPAKRAKLEDGPPEVDGMQNDTGRFESAGAHGMGTNEEKAPGNEDALPVRETQEAKPQQQQHNAPPSAVANGEVTGHRILPRTVAKRGGKAGSVGRPAQVHPGVVRADGVAAALQSRESPGMVREADPGAASTGAAAAPSDGSGQGLAGPAESRPQASPAAWIGEAPGGHHLSSGAVDGNVKVRPKTTARRGRGRGPGVTPRPPVAPPVEGSASAAATEGGNGARDSTAIEALGGDPKTEPAGAGASRVLLLLNVGQGMTSKQIHETLERLTGEAVEEVVLDPCSPVQVAQVNGSRPSAAALAPPVLVFCTSPAQALGIEKHINMVSAVLVKATSRPWLAQVLPSDAALSIYLVCRLYNRQPLFSLASSHLDIDSFNGAPQGERSADQGLMGATDNTTRAIHGVEFIPWDSREASQGLKEAQAMHMRRLQGLKSFLQRTF